MEEGKDIPEEKNPVGAPPIWKNVAELEKAIDGYFQFIKGTSDQVINPRPPEPPTITGLCLFLGFESRQSFHDYKVKPEFSYTLKRARLRIESEYEKKLHGNNVAGSIFALKNLGWADKQEVDHTSGGAPLSNKHVVTFEDYSK